MTVRGQHLVGAPLVQREDRFGWGARLADVLEVGDAAFDEHVRREMLAIDAVVPVPLQGSGISGGGNLSGSVETAEIVRRILDLADALATG